MFPDENTPDLIFDGVRFADLPILHAKFSKNNTLLILTDAKGRKYSNGILENLGFSGRVKKIWKENTERNYHLVNLLRQC